MKTVKVRIAVVVDKRGLWTAYGAHDLSDAFATDEAMCNMDNIASIDADPSRAVYFVGAELLIPQPTTIRGKVSKARKVKP